MHVDGRLFIDTSELRPPALARLCFKRRGEASDDDPGRMNRFREFPAELQLEVLSHLSTGDLRNVSLVSVALLRLSGSLLYKNIKLMGLSHAAELFVRVSPLPLVRIP